MYEVGLAAVLAVVLWWASTGIIIYLDGLPRKTFRWSMSAACVLSALCLWCLAETRNQTDVVGAYAGFTTGLVLWGAQAMSFYMGYITGPRVTSCPPQLTGWSRFIAAAQTNITHEIAILAGALVVMIVVGNGHNQLGLWTYLVLWWMHLSGKLNVFLGVPNLSEEFIPEHLAYLRSYMTKRSMNLLFPVSVTISTLITAGLVEQAIRAPSGSYEAVTATLLAVLMALAVLEHWLLVVPLPAMALWNWSLASRPKATPELNSTEIGPRAASPTPHSI